MYYLYVHTSPNSKRYIGVTGRPVDRWENGNGYDNNERFARDIKKYGWKNIKHEIIDCFDNKEEALHYEQLYIVLLNTENSSIGYNQTAIRDELLEKYNKKKNLSEYDEKIERQELDKKNIFDVYDVPYDAGMDLINQWILNAEHRDIVKDRLLNGLTFAELSKKYKISMRQMKRIVYDSQDKLLKHI